MSYPYHTSVLCGIKKKVDSEKVRKALDLVNWERLFNKRDIDAQIAVFNKIILNVFRNYVPNKYISVDEMIKILCG